MKSASNPPQRHDAEAAAKALGVRLVSLDVGSPEQLGKAFEAYAGEHVDRVIVPGDALFISERERIAALAISLRLPTIFPTMFIRF